MIDNAPHSLSILSPALIPTNIGKVPNMGDGLILLAVKRHLGSFDSHRVFSSRKAPNYSQREVLLASSGTILAGANQLDDNFTPWSGLTADAIRSSAYRFIPMGIGLHGDAHRNQSLAAGSRGILEVIHERIEFSSWRCPRTLEYLLREIPGVRDKALMTGCPVLYDRPLLESSRFELGQSLIAVTATERDDFWKRETQTINFVARHYASARKVLVVHQDYDAHKRPKAQSRFVMPWSKTPARLRKYAESRGYEILRPKSFRETSDFYKTVDMHFGSRLHAHLHTLSQNKRSFLTKVDQRAVGIAEHFQFPLCDPSRFEDYLTFDFERVREAALRTYPVLQKFLNSLHRPPA